MNWGPNTFEKNVSLDIFYKIFINISKIKFDIYKEKIGDMLKNPPPPSPYLGCLAELNLPLRSLQADRLMLLHNP